MVIINLSFVYVHTSVRRREEKRREEKRGDAECSIAGIHTECVRQKCKGTESGETEELDKG